MILLTLVFVVVPRDFSWEWHYFVTDKIQGLPIWENLQLNRQGRERIWAGGDKTDKIVTFWDVTLVPQHFCLYLYKVQRDGVLLGTEVYSKGRQEEGDVNRKVRQNKVVILKGLGKHWEQLLAKCAKVILPGNIWRKYPLQLFILSSCWMVISWYQQQLLCLFFFFYPEAQWLERSKLSLASMKDLCINIFISEGTGGRILLLSLLREAVHQVEQWSQSSRCSPLVWKERACWLFFCMSKWRTGVTP